MKILVTGGTGRIGANLVVRLLNEGHSIRSFVYPGDASRAHKLDAYGGVETIFGDLRNLEDVKGAVKGVDAIYHLGRRLSVDHSTTATTSTSMSMGTLNILESIRELCPDLHRFVYASTEGIYWSVQVISGRYFEEPITEDMMGNYPDMPYLLTKWLGEELAMAYHYAVWRADHCLAILDCH